MLPSRQLITGYQNRLYADLWDKNSADPYFDRSFDQKRVVHLAFGRILASKWDKSPS
jgi:hypothetical protein